MENSNLPSSQLLVSLQLPVHWNRTGPRRYSGRSLVRRLIVALEKREAMMAKPKRQQSKRQRMIRIQKRGIVKPRSPR